MYVRKEDRSKTVFFSHSSTYQYIRTPFGLTNAPSSFQRAFDVVLTIYKWGTCLFYLGDKIFYSDNVKDHVDHLDEILASLNQAKILFKITKCEFFTKRSSTLGTLSSPKNLKLITRTPGSYRKLPHQRKSQSYGSSIGLCNVYGRFVENLAYQAGYLHALLQKHSSKHFLGTTINSKLVET